MSDLPTRLLGPELGGQIPAGFEDLSEAQLQALASAVRDARHKQRDELNRALSAALEHVPFLLRGAVKRVLAP